jgi:hypothetical protein
MLPVPLQMACLDFHPSALTRAHVTGVKYHFTPSLVAFCILSYILGVFMQDLPGALDDAAITESLELHKIKSRQWAIFKASAIKGEGLFEGLDW